MINKKRLIKLTQSLIRINSENPGGNEFEIAAFIKKYFSQLGLNSKIYEFQKKRSNIIAYYKTNKSKKSLLVTPHLDTVPVGNKWKFSPFKGIIKGDKLYGLGATDCKCNLAVAIEVINSLIEENHCLDYNLVFAATADEECGSSLGLEALLDKKILTPDAALVLDADDFEIVVAQKGLMHIKIKIEGRRAHGAYPWLGDNAIDRALEIIRRIKQYRFLVLKNSYLRPPTINIGTIKGGDKVNIVADWCEFEIDIRFLPKESSKRILSDIKAVVSKFAPKNKIEYESIQEPFSIPEEHSLVNHLSSAMRKNRIIPRLSGSEGATTISFFQKHKIDSIASGFGTSGCAHIADEYCLIENLFKGAEIVEEFLKEFKF